MNIFDKFSAMEEAKKGAGASPDVDENLPADTAPADVDTAAETGDTTSDDWVSSLTPYEFQAAQDTEADDETTTAEPTAEQKEAFDKLVGFDHVDDEVADEIDKKLVKPKLSALEAEIKELKQRQRMNEETRAAEIRKRVNEELQRNYPSVDRIVRSKEFIEHVNSTSDPYAGVSGFDILSRAYHAGDVAYVLQKLDSFAATRGKPRPPLGAESGAGGGSDKPGRGAGVRMTEEEYLAKRAAIISARRGTYPPGALRQLADAYLNQSKGA